MTKEDLQLIPTEALINEIKSRHCAFVGIGLKTNIHGADQFLTTYSGGIAACLGLLDIMRTNLTQKYKKGEIVND